MCVSWSLIFKCLNPELTEKRQNQLILQCLEASNSPTEDLLIIYSNINTNFSNRSSSGDKSGSYFEITHTSLSYCKVFVRITNSCAAKQEAFMLPVKYLSHLVYLNISFLLVTLYRNIYCANGWWSLAHTSHLILPCRVPDALLCYSKKQYT